MVFTVLLAFGVGCRQNGESQDRPSAEASNSEVSSGDQSTERQPAKAADAGPPPVAEREGWSLNLADLTAKEIPDRPATGFIRTKPFKIDKAELANGILNLQQGTDFFADLSIMVFTFAEMETIEGKTFKVSGKDPGFQFPHIHMKWKPDGAEVPKADTFMKGYAMKLEFGKKADGKLPGRIYLCLPDPHKSIVAGTFEAILE